MGTQDHLEYNARIQPEQIKAAALFGRLVAIGMMSIPECVAALKDACTKAGYQGDMPGLQSHLTWLVVDGAEDWERIRVQADAHLRRSIAPMFDAGASGQKIVDHVSAYNAERENPLLSHEIRDILDDEYGWFLVRSRRTKGRRHV